MTLVTATKIRDVPVVLGDILISSQHDTGHPVPLPTRRDAGNLLPPGYSIASVRRKVTVLHDRLAVAWAGRQIGAQRVIKDLRRWLQETDLDRDHLFVFLDGYGDLGSGARCELVGWIVDDAGPIAFHWNMTDVWAGHDEYITGSGKEDFAKLVGGRRIFYGSPDLTPDAQVVHICLTLAGYGIGREVLSGDSLSHGYGGGMEVALFTEGRFSVVTDANFLFWRVEFDPERKESRIAHVPTELKYLHINDCLVVRTRTIDERGGQEGRIHIVTHVDQDEEEVSWVATFQPFVSGKSKCYCNCVVGRAPGYGDIVGTLVLQEPNDFLKFTQDIVDGKVIEERLELSDDFLRILHQTLEATVSGHGPSASP